MSYQEILELTKMALQYAQEMQKSDPWITVTPESYRFYRDFALTQQKEAPKKEIPAENRQISEPAPAKAAAPAPLAAKPQEPPKTPVKRIPPAPKPDKALKSSEPSKETPSSSTLELKPLAPPPELDFSSFRAILAKHFPAQKMMDEPAILSECKRKKVALLAPKVPLFVSLAKAIEISFPAFSVSFALKPDDADFVIGTTKLTDGAEKSHQPFLFLENAEAYLENPAKKKELWEKIKAGCHLTLTA